MKEADLRGPGAEECDVVHEGGLGDLLQWLEDIVHIHMAEQHPQPEAALQLSYARVDVLWLQQVEPAQAAIP